MFVDQKFDKPRFNKGLVQRMAEEKAKILVAENSPLVRHHITSLLQLEGFHTIEASDGEEAFAKAMEQRPDLIIAEILLPRLSGLELLDKIRKSEALATIPFILLSAQSTREAIRRGMEKGADDYIPKPFTTAELLKAVHRLLHRIALVQSSIEHKLQQLREVMFYALPHEFRTAVSGIRGYADLLIQGLGNGDPLPHEELREIGIAIQETAMRLNRLVENFIIYGQLQSVAEDEAVKHQMRQKVTNPATEVVHDVALSLAQQYHRESDLHLSLTHPVPIAIEYQHWHKIIYEIVDNALKFSSPGAAIAIRDRIDKQDYIVAVQDHGRGMSEAQRAQIAPYVQFGRKQYEQQGMGLGLAISLLLIEFHRGALQFDDTPGGGTTVTITMPIATELSNAS